MRYLGIDYGSKRVGLALSDEAGLMGFPHAIISNTKKLVSDVCELIEKEKVDAIVIGKSENLSGEANAIAKDAEIFGEAISFISQKPVFFESEIFTTAEARRAPEKELKSRAPKKHEKVDASAAALILTSYLSRTHHG